MNRVAALLALALTPCLASACQEKKEPPPAATAAPVATPAPLPAPVATPTPIATAAAPVVADLATPEDFEQQALDEINPQNLEVELDKLEREIGQ